MKNKILVILLGAILTCFMLTGCNETEAQRVTYNLSQEADNFNVVREITVINCITGDVLFKMSGRMSVETDSNDNKLDVIVEKQKGLYEKHFIGLSDNVTYVIEQLDVKNVSEYQYTLNYNPKMWIPINVNTID